MRLAIQPKKNFSKGLGAERQPMQAARRSTLRFSMPVRVSGNNPHLGAKMLSDLAAFPSFFRQSGACRVVLRGRIWQTSSDSTEASHSF